MGSRRRWNPSRRCSTATWPASPVADQAALHGVIHLVNALGLELLEVRRLPTSGAANGAPQKSDDHSNEEQR